MVVDLVVALHIDDLRREAALAHLLANERASDGQRQPSTGKQDVALVAERASSANCVAC
jgi:hypothetical protein